MKFIKSTLGKIALEIKTGKTPPTSNPEYFGDELNWYTPTDLDREKILGNSKRRITQKALIDKKVVVLKPNTVLLGCIGDIGKVGLIKESASSNQQITGILPKQEIVNSEFLYYWLKSNKNRLKDTSTTAIVPILNNKQLSTIKIEYPENIDDQIRIAEILNQAENLITQRKVSISFLDELLKSTFLEMFGDIIETSSSKLEYLGDNISYLTSGSRGWAKYYSESGAKFLRIQNIGGGVIRTDNLINVNPPNSAETERTRVQEGDLIISITADLGRTSVVPKNFGEAYINQHLALIRLNQNINPIYAAYFYNMPFGNNAIQKKNRSAVKAGLNFNDIKSFPIIIPKIELQNKFVTIVEKVEFLKKEYEASLRELENMYGVLSQKAFKGELDLSKTAIPEVIINSNTFSEKPLEEVSDNNSEYLKINIEKKIDEIIKNYKNEKLFSIDMIHRELDQYKIQFNVTQAKIYIKQLMEKDIIIQEYSGDTKQVMFKLKK